tara:strand:- start:1970 stop:2158 length:189 start_codon:yes stop_codon:yes gene_type:complete
MEETVLTDDIIRGLKAKLKYQGCRLDCTPADKCECDEVLDLIEKANEWIENLPGDIGVCQNG